MSVDNLDTDSVEQPDGSDFDPTPYIDAYLELGTPGKEDRLLYRMGQLATQMDRFDEEVLDVDKANAWAIRAFAGVVREAGRDEGRDEMRSKFEQSATVDALTGLRNRHVWDDTLDAAVAEASFVGDRRQANARKIVFFVDMDKFKGINDNYGHVVGDDVLIDAAIRLELQAGRPEDIVARIGGDEFGIIMNVDFENEEDAEEWRIRKTEQMIEDLHAVIETNGKHVEFSASIGSTFINEGDTSEIVRRRADELMYENKNGGNDDPDTSDPAIVPPHPRMRRRDLLKDEIEQ